MQKVLEKKLDTYSNFNIDPSYCMKFLEITDNMIMSQDPEKIKILFKYFDDNTEYSWVLEEIITSMLGIETDKCIPMFLTNLHYFFEKAPVWCAQAFNVIFNTKEVIEFFEQNMYLAYKEDLLKLFDLMGKEYPHHKELIESLRKKL